MFELATVADLPSEFAAVARVLQLGAQLLGDYSTKAVNGRQLQEALESTKDHTNWARYQIKRLNLKEGRDFEILCNLSSPNLASSKARPQMVSTFVFTVDAAKHVAMSAGTAGESVRGYFLHMEKTAQAAYQGRLPAQLTGEPVKDAIAAASWESEQIRRAMGDAWGQPYHQKVTHDTFKRYGDAYGVDIESRLPALTMSLPTQVEEADPTKGEHLLGKAVGSLQLSTKGIADQFGLTVTGLWKGLVASKVVSPLKHKRSRSNSGYVIMPDWSGKELATMLPLGELTNFPGIPVIKVLHWPAFPAELRASLKAFATENQKYAKRD